MTVAALLAELIGTVSRDRIRSSELAPETSLVDGAAALDSVQVLELVVAVEERFGVELRAEDFQRGGLATFGQLTELVAARCAR
jgi:acyl carrier protein